MSYEARISELQAERDEALRDVAKAYSTHDSDLFDASSLQFDCRTAEIECLKRVVSVRQDEPAVSSTATPEIVEGQLVEA